MRARVPVGGWWLVSGVLLVLQVPGCWCEPVLPERFNAFPDGEPGGAADYCTAWAPAACSHAERCEPATWAAFQGSTCTETLEARCQRDHAVDLAGVAAGRVNYDNRLARGCIDDEATRPCGQDPSPACAEVFTGAVVADGPCREDRECADGLFCSGGPDTCGLCVARYAEGGPCWGATSCQPGLVCTDGRCLAPLRRGDACTGTTTPCPAGTVCFPPFPPLGVCTPLGIEGSACSLAGGFSVPCGDGLTCAATDGGARCRGPGDEGAPCDSAGAGQPPCKDDGVRLYCDSTSRACTAVRVSPAGGTCGASSLCPATQRCVNGTCVARPVAGESCSTTTDACLDSHCTGGTCVAAARAGEPCDAGCPGLTCVSGTCGTEPCDGGVAWDAGLPAPDGGAGITP